MALINFKNEFVQKILSGEKKQTIRKLGKNPIKVGDTLYLYTGLRTKNAKKLKEVKCTSIDRIYIGYLSDDRFAYYVSLNGFQSDVPIKEIAMADGFANTNHTVDNFIKFFDKHYGLPFNGQIIKWSEVQDVHS